jgi:hypothetical protein
MPQGKNLLLCRIMIGEMALHPSHILKRRENKEGGGVLLWN